MSGSKRKPFRTRLAQYLKGETTPGIDPDVVRVAGIEGTGRIGAEGVSVCVADNGCGVSDKVRNVMFEPLEGTFSEGTGMGLPIVQFLASRYEGQVSLVEKPPGGYQTQFLVLLRNIGENK